MKKFHVLSFASLIAAAAIFSPSNVRAQAFPEGSNSVTVGYGFVTVLGALNSTFDTYSDLDYSSLGPLYFKFEHAVSDNIGLGLNVAYAGNDWSYKYDYSDVDANGNAVTRQYVATQKRTTYSILARFNYHFGSNDRLDPYLGLGLGYRNANWTYSTTDPSGSESGVDLPNLVPLGFELTFGARYFFTDNIGAYMEVGAAKSILQAGLSVKF